ncbi:MAG: prolyl oligopeptidase family serine peptidase [Thermoplasmatota archaeon]
MRTAAVATVLLFAMALPGQAGLLDDLPVEPVLISKPVARGGIETAAAPDVSPTTKVVDGDPSDWVGESTRLGGQTLLSRGELVHQDYVFDDFGADNGKDAQRYALTGPLADAEPRTFRTEPLSQAAGTQFGAGAADPTGGVIISVENYGDAVLPGGLDGLGDLVELRLAADETDLYVLARLRGMTDEATPALLLLAGVGGGAAAAVPWGAGLSSTATDAFLVSAAGVEHADLATGMATAVPGAAAAVDPTGFTNAIEVRIPRSLLPDSFDLAAGVGLLGGGDLADLTPETDGGNLANVAFRPDEAVNVWNDRAQALALEAGDIDAFTHAVDLDALAAGAHQEWQPTPGYHERVFQSGPSVAREEGRQGMWQHYGLFLPTGWTDDEPSPLTYWLHWRGGTAHQAAAWTPRVFTQLGQENGHVMASPYGRGTSGWYVGQAHTDFWEVHADLHDLVAIDPDRRTLSGYSMGGYGTYLLGLMYPDLWAGGYSISGATTQGAWIGLDDATSQDVVEADGDAPRQLTYRLLENARHYPLMIHHGTNDELVPVTGVTRFALRLHELGYEHQYTLFPGYEHYTQAIVDEWSEGARYLAAAERPAAPAHVTLKRVPALEDATRTVNAPPSGPVDLPGIGSAWWLHQAPRAAPSDDVTVYSLADVVSHALPGRDAGQPTVALPQPGHSTPGIGIGLGGGGASMATLENRFTAELTNVGELRLDVAAMGLDTAATLEGTLETDGAATVVLDGIPDSATVMLDGAPAGPAVGGVLSLVLGAGSYELVVTPA